VRHNVANSIVAAMTLAMLASRAGFAQTPPTHEARRLAPLPAAKGVSGIFAGTSQGMLLVAGGANFPAQPPWEGGRKVWYDTVYALARPDAAWQVVGQLPRPLGYGVAMNAMDGVVCIGGSDAARHYADVFLLRMKHGRSVIRPLPALPVTIANACGAMIGDTIYLAGGNEAPQATTALDLFLALNLSERDPHWRRLPTWPGPPRMMATAGACDGAFYLFSGVRLTAGPDGKPARTYLRDAYCYTPGKGWRRLTDLPRAAAAAPTPAPEHGKTLVVLGGDDGTHVGFQPPAKHPGFSREVLAYRIPADAWTVLGSVPAARVNLPAVTWQGNLVLASGEVRPGVRSPQVWSLALP
jgi:N-acetylneuraminate epimerase